MRELRFMRHSSGNPRKTLARKLLGLQRKLTALEITHEATLAECRQLRQELAWAGLPEESAYSNLPELFDHLGEFLFDLPGVDGCAFYLLNQAGDALVTAHLKLTGDFAGIEKAYRGFQHPLAQPDVNVDVLTNGRPQYVSEANHALFGEITTRRFHNMNMRSLIVVPLNVMQEGVAKAIGVVSLLSHHADLDPELAEVAMVSAGRHAVQIQSLWMRRQALEWGKSVEDMYAEIQQHITFITELNSVVDLEQIHGLISQRFIQRFGFDAVAILMAEGNELVFAHVDFSLPCRFLHESYRAFGQRTRYQVSPPDAACAVVFANNQRFMFDDVRQVAHLPMTDKDRESLKLLGDLRTSLLVPIRLNDQPIGILWLGSLIAPVPLSDADLALIELLASYVSTAIRNAEAHALIGQQRDRIERLNQELQSKIVLLDRVAHKDRLTGLNNFGSFEEELKRKTSEVLRFSGQHALSTIILDVDHFKQFNDRYGHPAGNRVLKEFADRILASVREVDFVARYGGEEFVVLLPECDLAGAAMTAERIRNEIGCRPFRIDDREHVVTVSGGCGQFSGSERPADFISRVDAALYKAKQNGRNRIELAWDVEAFIDKTVA